MMNTKLPDPSLGFLINDVARLMRRDFNQRVAGLGLTQAQWRAMVNLARDEGCRQTDLAAVMEIAPITLARLVDRLQESGLVERRQHPADRRAVQLYYTPKGRRLQEKLRDIARRTYDRALGGVAAADRDQLLRTLHEIRDNLADTATLPAPSRRAHAHGR